MIKMYIIRYKNKRNKLPMITRCKDFKVMQKKIDNFIQKGYEIEEIKLKNF